MATPFGFTNLGPLQTGSGYDNMLKALLYQGEQKSAGVRALGDTFDDIGKRREREQSFNRQAALQKELLAQQGGNEMLRDLRQREGQADLQRGEQGFQREQAGERRSFEFSQKTADRELERDIAGMRARAPQLQKLTEQRDAAEKAQAELATRKVWDQVINDPKSSHFRDASVVPMFSIAPSGKDEDALDALGIARPYAGTTEGKAKLEPILKALKTPIKARFRPDNEDTLAQLFDEVEARVSGGKEMSDIAHAAMVEQLQKLAGSMPGSETDVVNRIREDALKQAGQITGMLAPTTTTTQAVEQPGIAAGQQASMPEKFNMRLDDLADPEELERMTGNKQLSGLLRSLLVGSTGKAIPVGVNEDAEGGVSFDLPDETAPRATQSILKQLEQALNTPGIARDKAIGMARTHGQSPTRSEAMKVGGKNQPKPGKTESPAAESMAPTNDVDRLQSSFPELYEYLRRP